MTTRRRSALRTISLPAAAFVALLLSWPSAFILLRDGSHRNSHSSLAMGQISADQASSAISMLLKQNQESACDGERLEIKCNDDFVIEIITAELTILERERHEWPRPWLNGASGSNSSEEAKQQDIQVNGARTEPSPASSSSGNQAQSQTAESSASPSAELRQTICPALQFASQFGGATPATGNETLQMIQNDACTEAEAREASNERKAKFLALVKKQCSLLNSCSLDLRFGWPELEAAASQLAGGNKSSPASQLLGQFLTEKCPSNRKLLELAFKCRPSRVRSRSACRNSKLTLECPEAQKRLAIGSAMYGFWPEDKKLHDKCLLQAAADEAQSNLNDRTQLMAQINKTPACSTLNMAQPLAVLAGECLFKRHCQLQVAASAFSAFESSCSSQALSNLAYLKVVYVCINEDLLLTTNASLIQRQLVSSSGGGGGGGGKLSHQNGNSSQDSQASGSRASGAGSGSGQSSASSFVSPNVSSSSLLASNAPAEPQQFITPPVHQQQQQQDGTITRHISLIAHHQPTQQSSNQDEEELTQQTGRVYAVVASDPQLNSVHPSNWTPSQRVKFVLLRYQTQLVAFAVITLTVSTVLALFVRLIVCSRRGQSTRQSTASSSSSKSESLQKCTFGSAGSSSSASSSQYASQPGCTATVSSQQLLSAGVGLSHHHHHQQHHQHQQHLLNAHHNSHPNNYVKTHLNETVRVAGEQKNSCSESCFSLEDFNCLQQAQTQKTLYQTRDSATTPTTNSPALQSNRTTPPVEQSSGAQLGKCAEHQQVAWSTSTGANTLASGGARPKLWSFYGNEQHSSSLRLGNFGPSQQQQQQQQAAALNTVGNSTTLRAHRSFMGQQPPALARNFECLQQQAIQTQTQTRTLNESQPNGLEPHQSEYLLAMASVGQHPLKTGQQQRGGWCPHSSGPAITTTSEDGGEHTQHLLALNAADLQQLQQQPPIAPMTNGNLQTCAFHSQQQQQPQQMFVATGQQPPVELDFDQSAPATIQPHLQPAATSNLNNLNLNNSGNSNSNNNNQAGR